MYAKLISNLPLIELKNGKLHTISNVIPTEEQKPFLLFTPTDSQSSYLCFVHRETIYVSMFRSTNLGIISRLRTVIDALDRSLKAVDLPAYLVRHGLPLKVMTFGKKQAILTEIDLWETQSYHFNAGTQVENLIRDLRDLLYV